MIRLPYLAPSYQRWMRPPRQLLIPTFPTPHLARFSTSSTLHRNSERFSLLRKIYSPAIALDENSPERAVMESTGKCWYNYFRPDNPKPYEQIQKEHRRSLERIETLRKHLLNHTKLRSVAEKCIGAYACQSVQIENNRLEYEDARIIYDRLQQTLQQTLQQMSIDLPLSPPSALLLHPTVDESQIAELRNHLLISQWINSNATLADNTGTAGLDEQHIRWASAFLVRDTSSIDVFRNSWGKRIQPGQYRTIPIGIRNVPLRIFPYPNEVPGLMRRFLSWRDDAHMLAIKGTGLHPLVLACQICVYFVFIHPFLDGNGRVSRCVMQDYLLRQGYLPVVFPTNLFTKEMYVKMISEAQDGDPSSLVGNVVQTELDMLESVADQL